MISAKINFESLRVLVQKEGDTWTAQGLEIYYAASGPTEEIAKLNFSLGLANTLKRNFQRFGEEGIERMKGKVAPEDVWHKYMDAERAYLLSGAVDVPIQAKPVEIPDNVRQFLPDLALAFASLPDSVAA